jgi:hypothetical protein
MTVIDGLVVDNYAREERLPGALKQASEGQATMPRKLRIAD